MPHQLNLLVVVAGICKTTVFEWFGGQKKSEKWMGWKSMLRLLSPSCIQAAVQPMRRKGKGALGARCDFIGSPTNLVTISSKAIADWFLFYVKRWVLIRVFYSFYVRVGKQIMVTSTSLMLFAGRFGLAPSANRKATAGLKLEVRDSGLQTGDPAGFTLADTLACGTVGHIIGVGVVLGLKNIGVL